MLLSFTFIVSKIEHNKDNLSSNSVSENWFRNNKRKTINIYVKFSSKQFTLPVHMTTHYCKDDKIQIKKKNHQQLGKQKIIINLKYDLHGRNIVFAFIDLIIVCIEYDTI